MSLGWPAISFGWPAMAGGMAKLNIPPKPKDGFHPTERKHRACGDPGLEGAPADPLITKHRSSHISQRRGSAGYPVESLACSFSSQQPDTIYPSRDSRA